MRSEASSIENIIFEDTDTLEQQAKEIYNINLLTTLN